MNSSNAKDVLSRNYDLLRFVVEEITDPIHIKDLQGRYLMINSAGARLLGKSVEEVTGKNDMELFAPDAARHIIEQDRQIIETGTAQPFEDFRIVMGVKRTCLSTKWPYHDSQGNVAGIICICRDITGQRQVEEALRASEERFRTVVKSMNDIVFTLDREQRHTGVFGLWIARFGLTPEFFLGKTASEVLGKEAGAVHEAANERALAGEHVVYEWAAETAGGTLHFETSLSPLQDSTGAVVGIVGVGRDITKNKRAEQELRESEAKYRLLVENMNEVVYAVSFEEQDPFAGTVRFVGGQVENILGYRPDEFLRDAQLWFRIIHADDMPGVVEVTRRMLVCKEETVREYRLRHKKTGDYLWVEDRIVPQIDESGKVVGIVGVARDMTKRKQTEERLLAYQQQLASLVSELSFAEERERRRIATELHDRVSQNLSVCRIKLKAQKSMISDERSLDEMDRLIKESIGEIRTLIFELGPPILYELGFEPAVEWFAEHVREKLGIKIDFRDDRQPKPLLEDVRVLLFQATRELMMNVVKHSQASSARVSLRRDGDNLEIKVEDDGIGFEPCKLHLPDGQTKGFGLFNIRERLKHIGGFLDIKSEPGRGTCVTLVAPLRRMKDEGGRMKDK